MDLREKPGKVQKFFEISLRIRLISVVLAVVLAVTLLATNWNAMSSLPLAASEAFGMWFANVSDFGTLWQSAQYVVVAGLALVVLQFVFGGIRAGIAGIVSAGLFLGSLMLLGGSEGMQLPFYGVLAGVSLIALIFVKASFACALFPFAFIWLFMTGSLKWFGLENGLVWAGLSTVFFSNAMAFAFVAGKELGEGTPQAGALVKSAKKMLVPVTCSSLLMIVATVVDMSNVDAAGIAKAAGLWVVFFLTFFFMFFGMSSFAPWDRLRAGNRRVQMKEKKKPAKK